MKKRSVLILSIIFSLSMTACGSSTSSISEKSDTKELSESSTSYSTSLSDIKNNGKLVIGLDDTFAPMGFRDEDNNLVGFDIDLAAAACNKLGVSPEFKPIDWDAKEMDLSSGKIDCIWNGLSITPKNQENMSMSNAYLNNKIVVMTKKGIDIESKDDLAKYKLGIQTESSALEMVSADDIYSSIENNLTEYPTYDEAIMDMGAGRIDGIIVDEVLAKYKNKMMDDKYDIASINLSDDLYGVGFRKSDEDLTQAVNDAIKSLIDDGTAAKISEKWFGSDIVIR